MTSLRSLGAVTALALAHVSAAGADQKAARPYGSVYYANEARMTWELRKAEDEPEDLVVALYNQKVNAGRKHRPLGFRFTFHEDAIRVSGAELAEAPDLLSRATAWEQIRAALSNGPKAAEAIAIELDLNAKSVRKTLERRRAKGHVITLDGTNPLKWALASTRQEA